ncbi:MAG TPA: hypothetical protein VHH34_06095, partial [Pseudonocardiaceae bacterium]|nr:hypothetical protein [Pseudonocardiaceae bacterium]
MTATPPASLELSPHRAALHLPRTTLYHLLDAATQHRVCLVIAGAGWGKTTTLRAWAQTHQTAWLSLGSTDAQLGRLHSRLVTTLRLHLPELSVAFGEPGPDDEHAWHSRAVDMCAQLDSLLRDDLVLVLDDCQELGTAGPTVQLVEELCRYAPEALHLVLVSRREPPFSVERLRGQGHVSDINAADLAFGIDEVTALLQANIGDEVSDLAGWVRRKTGGWPAATCMAAQALRGVEPQRRHDTVEQLSRPGGRLNTYLIEEVLAHETEPVREFLRHIAVLGEVNLPVARRVGDDDAERLLSDLVRRGLVSTAGSTPSWSVLPPLRDHLDDEAITTSDERAALHRTAARESVERGSYARALRHFIAAGDHSAVTSLLTEYGTTLISAGEINAVLAAVELPATWLEDPHVQGVIGYAHQVRGQWSSVLEQLQRTTQDQEELQPAVAWRMGLVYYARGELDAALAMYRRARLGREDTADEAQLLAWSAAASRLVGDYDRCCELATRALVAAQRCPDLSARAAAYSALALLAAAQGDPLHTEEYGAVALHAAESADDLLETVRVRAFRAMHLLARGRPTEGLQEAEITLELNERCGHRLGVALALTHRGTARARLGQLEDALGSFMTARDLFQDMGSRFVAWPLIGIGSVYRMRGQLAQARAAYEEGLAMAEPCHEILGLAGALIGLARTRASDDIAAARDLAERAVALGEGLYHVQALLTRGWIALAADDREAASADAARAAERARSGRDNPGLAEALELTVLAAAAPAEALGLLEES